MDTTEVRAVSVMNYQAALISQISKITSMQPTPGRLTDREQEKQFCYHAADIFANNGLIRRYLTKPYVFNGIFYEPLNEGNLKYFIYDTVYKSGVILTEKKCNLIIEEILIRIPDYNGILNDERYTLFQNAYINNITGELATIIPDYFPTMCVEAKYFFNFPNSP